MSHGSIILLHVGKRTRKLFFYWCSFTSRGCPNSMPECVGFSINPLYMWEYVSAVQTEACVPLEGSALRCWKHLVQASFFQNVKLPHSGVCRALLEKWKVPQRSETWSEVWVSVLKAEKPANRRRGKDSISSSDCESSHGFFS